MVELVWRFWKDKELRETNDRLMMKSVRGFNFFKFINNTCSWVDHKPT